MSPDNDLMIDIILTGGYVVFLLIESERLFGPWRISAWHDAAVVRKSGVLGSLLLGIVRFVSPRSFKSFTTYILVYTAVCCIYSVILGSPSYILDYCARTFHTRQSMCSTCTQYVLVLLIPTLVLCNCVQCF